jgi:hypothetical protein
VKAEAEDSSEDFVNNVIYIYLLKNIERLKYSELKMFWEEGAVT